MDRIHDIARKAAEVGGRVAIMEKGLSAVALGSFFGVSRQIIDRWRADGIIAQRRDGNFDLKVCTRAVYRHMRKQISGRAGTDTMTAARAASLQASSKLKNQQQKAAELRLARQRGELVERTGVRRVVLAFAIRFRAAMLSLEPRIGARLPHLSVDDRATIEAIIHETLREIVNTDPETVLADVAA